jgi:NADPH-dependent curcumin reductase CurA
VRGREIHLVARPDGEPRESDFALAEVDVPDPGPGEVLVRNTWMSVDPAMRPRMDDIPSYAPPYALGAPMDGAALGEVVASGVDGLEPGQAVVHWLGWREYALVHARHSRGIRPVDLDLAGPEAHLSVLGHTGLTAYVGLFDVAALAPGDVVFVSGAAGAVGSIVGQMAKLRGHRVIGSAGSPEKVAHLRDELGFDAAFDYHQGPVGELLRAAAPDGIDVYFDNVGGRHLEAAVDVMRVHGRVAICGTISTYNDAGEPEGLRNQFQLVAKRLTLRGFLMRDHLDRMDAFLADAAGWLREGRLRQRTTVVEGLERAPEAFIGMLRGANLGKMLVRFD